MKKSNKRIGGVAAISISALALAAGASVAADGPQQRVNGAFSSGTDFLKASYKAPSGSVDIWIKQMVGGIDIKISDANGTMDKFIPNETTEGADAFFKYLKIDSADYFIKLSDGNTLDVMSKANEGGGVTGIIIEGGRPAPN